METSTYEIGGMSCDGCVSKLSTALEKIPGIKLSHVEVGNAVIGHEGELNEEISAAIVSCGFTVGSDFSWSDSAVWKKSAHNTKWCLIGCSIGDFGTIASFQFVFTDSGWSTMSIMILAIINGLLTSIALETVILSKQMGLFEGFKVAIGMSFISMVAMESAMNVTDYLMTGGAMLTLWAVPIMLIVGFITPWPYNYWRLKKYGVSCH